MNDDVGTHAEKHVGVFVLAKDERANIGRCLKCLEGHGWDVTVLDSGSTDGTVEIVRGYSFARVQSYRYVNHCQAYNEITTKLGTAYQYVLVLDADMMVSRALAREVDALLSQPAGVPEVIEAPIEMCVDGLPLRFGSLYPPKPFVFRSGRKYFVALGHGESLQAGEEAPLRTRHALRHDDRKGYSAYLASQERYSRAFVARRAAGQLSGRDRIRAMSPLFILAAPFVSYVVKGGFLSGRAGLIYALDRLIAEAIMYRRSLSGVPSE